MSESDALDAEIDAFIRLGDNARMADSQTQTELDEWENFFGFRFDESTSNANHTTQDVTSAEVSERIKFELLPNSAWPYPLLQTQLCCQWNSSLFFCNAVNMEDHTSGYIIHDTTSQKFSDLSAHAEAYKPTCIGTIQLPLLSDDATKQRTRNFAMRRISRRRLRRCA